MNTLFETRISAELRQTLVGELGLDDEEIQEIDSRLIAEERGRESRRIITELAEIQAGKRGSIASDKNRLRRKALSARLNEIAPITHEGAIDLTDRGRDGDRFPELDEPATEPIGDSPEVFISGNERGLSKS